MEKSERYKLATVTPNKTLLDFHRSEFNAFVHYSVNNYAGRQWGKGTEDPKIFRPFKLDTDQWARAVKSAGAKAIILTAKHHDGFALWPTKYSNYSAAASPVVAGRDIVKMVSESCKKYGLKFGVYYSFADAHEETYGTTDYYDWSSYRGGVNSLIIN